MNELKPCPFCGGEAITTAFFDADDFDYMPIEVNDCDAEVTCENERCINGWYLSPKAWNTRPIEDALRAQLAARDALMERLVEAGHLLCDYAILVSVDHPIGDGQMAINDKAAWEALVAEYRASKDGGGK